MKLPKKFLLLGSGELGKEFVISAQRLGCHVVAVDSYAGAPAMQVADECEVINMLDGEELQEIVLKHKPDFIVPEVEAIRTEKLLELEEMGFTVVPTARATNYTMNRDRIRELASKELNLRTAKYAYAHSLDELIKASDLVGFPNVVKPVMSSSGKGQSTVNSLQEVQKAWDYAIAGSRGDSQKVIVEEFINFESEITLLTIKQRSGTTLFCEPIGHRQERGDYQESWQPALINPQMLLQAQEMAAKVIDALCRSANFPGSGGAGIFGVEFFVTKNEVIFSELSPRPHDTGMVTLISQNLSEFDLHLRAILGLPIPNIKLHAPSASAVILSQNKGEFPIYEVLEGALEDEDTDLRIFGKPSTRSYRRMGVALAQAKDTDSARQKAKRVASSVKLLSEVASLG
ncbi:MAG: formate-dependent phosphoribosylglycinamide formyltransferase [Candidatus Caenarcaniphilales bacterium]|nr:formate-dependent phosphoribosylglycinamide formyltransferase [Candidatus Caenarcaniphilales bacterium]